MYLLTLGRHRTSGVRAAFATAAFLTVSIFGSTCEAVVLESSSFLGGSGYDRANLVALGPDGAVYVAGQTESSDFPSARLLAGSGSLFVAKITDAGVAWTSRFGGTVDDRATALALAPDGSIVVGGTTWSADFPLVGALSTALGEKEAASFLTKLTANGSQIVFSTFIPGTQIVPAGSYVWPRTEVPAPSPAVGIAVDASGRIYVAGTAEADFPVTVSGAPPFAGKTDVFVARLAADGSQIQAATRFGGDEYDAARAIALSADGRVYVAGATNSTALPAKAALQPTSPDHLPGQQISGFYAQLGADLDSLDVLSYLGGQHDDEIDHVAINEHGLFLAGNSASFNFPTTASAYRSRPPNTNSGTFGVVARIDPDEPRMIYSTFIAPLGTSIPSWEATSISGFAVDGSGTAHVVGSTLSDTLELVEPINSGATGWWDVFYARLDPEGAAFTGSTYLGALNLDFGNALAVSESGDAVLTGMTFSPRFPAKNAFQRMKSGLSDAFVARLAPGTPVSTTLVIVSTTTTSSSSYDDTPDLDCGDPNGDGVVSAADALAVLRAALSLEFCDVWVCDVDGSGTTTAADALAVLSKAVGSEVHPFCGI